MLSRFAAGTALGRVVPGTAPMAHPASRITDGSRRSLGAFTLIEMMVVIVLIGAELDTAIEKRTFIEPADRIVRRRTM